MEDVDGNAEELVLEVGYEFATGLKLWEKDGRGYVTEYRYDKLGRQIAQIFPDEDDDLAWDPRSGSSSARANNPQES